MDDNAKPLMAKATPKKGLAKLKEDIIVLKNIWFHRIDGNTHAERLDNFYRGQAKQYDSFRDKFLWGRRPMLQELARRLQNVPDGSLTWVDLGGGTGENVQMMSEYLPLSKFKQIYVVDLCKALCEVAQAKVDAKGWTNVRVVEADACTFKPDESRVSLVTFSYSLSMIPPFLTAVDNARSFLSPDGLLGVCDFYTAQKYEDKPVKMSWARRFFWRATFDIDGIDVGPERRMYLHHVLSTVHENTSQGSIPYVPWLRAPFYVFVGKAGV